MVKQTVIPETAQHEILAIAHEIRNGLGKSCDIAGQCEDASLALSQRLTQARVPNIVVGGQWKGPITKSMGAQEFPRLHVWVMFPQFDYAIIDVTADQFTDRPAVWFPANPKDYSPTELIENDWFPARSSRPLPEPIPASLRPAYQEERRYYEQRFHQPDRARSLWRTLPGGRQVRLMRRLSSVRVRPYRRRR